MERFLALSPDKLTLVTATDIGLVTAWLFSNGAAGQMQKDHTAKVTDLDFSADGNVFCSASADLTIARWHLVLDRKGLARSTSMPAITGHVARITGITLNRNGSIIASGDENGTSKLWDNAHARGSLAD